MIVLLPPSEGKTAPTVGAPLELSDLANECPHASTRAGPRCLDSDVHAHTYKGPHRAWPSPNQRDEVSANAGLATANTAPAWQVYTGVLFWRPGLWEPERGGPQACSQPSAHHVVAVRHRSPRRSDRCFTGCPVMSRCQKLARWTGSGDTTLDSPCRTPSVTDW